MPTIIKKDGKTYARITDRVGIRYSLNQEQIRDFYRPNKTTRKAYIITIKFDTECPYCLYWNFIVTQDLCDIIKIECAHCGETYIKYGGAYD